MTLLVFSGLVGVGMLGTWALVKLCVRGLDLACGAFEGEDDGER